ncbi:MAG: carbonic anhydrase [Anaerosomatales bacterium]|nr:carbonic anhydrase [Anaerosomatales bacterium]
MDPKASIERLAEGNRRFIAGQRTPVDLVRRRQATAGGQRPWAAIVACADARVAPEIVFDTTLGDLFVVRTGGNVVDELVLGSLRFGVETLGAPVIVVLGHYGCGAVQATCAGDTPEHLACVCDEVLPSAEAARAGGATAEVEVCDEAVRLHAEAMASRVRDDTFLGAAVPVVWGVYDVATGEVRMHDTAGVDAG